MKTIIKQSKGIVAAYVFSPGTNHFARVPYLTANCQGGQKNSFVREITRWMCVGAREGVGAFGGFTGEPRRSVAEVWVCKCKRLLTQTRLLTTVLALLLNRLWISKALLYDQIQVV